MEIPAHSLIIKKFQPILADVIRHDHTHYWLDGGRASTKTSFIAIAVVLLIMQFPTVNAVIARRVANTLRDSVVLEIAKAISRLGVASLFIFNKSVMDYTYIPTGQRIVFRGCDDPSRLKGATFKVGYSAILWFEELAEFASWEDVRSATQTFIRGDGNHWVFYSYNPPQVAHSWVNEEAIRRMSDGLTRYSHSSYLDVVEHNQIYGGNWLGNDFLLEADSLKATNPRAYEHEYLGVVTGTGGSVFTNIVTRNVPDSEIETFDNIHNGCDFGFFPDPWVMVRAEYQPQNKRIILYEEHEATRMLPCDTAEIIRSALTYSDNASKAAEYHAQYVWCDDAGSTEIAEYRRRGLNARPAGKGNLRKQSYYWLAGLREIVIDPVRCPHALKEFMLCEFAKDRHGEFIDDFKDGNDHFIDAMRYAFMQTVIRGR